MSPSKKLQLKILEELKAKYPDTPRVSRLPCYTRDPDFMKNVIELHDIGAIEGDVLTMAGGLKEIVKARITDSGLRLIAEDDSLSAELNKVHIKFDSEDLKAIIAAQIDRSDLSGQEKAEVKGVLAALKDEGIKALCTEFIKIGIKSAPDVIRLVRKALFL